MNDLKPCPFCGGEAQCSEDLRFHISWFYCPGCGAASGYRNTEAEAIEAWNTRAERTSTPVDYIGEYYSHIVGESDEYYGAFCVCSECEKYVPMINYCPECGAKFERRDV